MTLRVTYITACGRTLTATCAWYLTDSAVACIVASGGAVRGVS